MSLGKRIKDARTSAKITRQGLGEILGVSQQIVFEWERDTSNPKIERLVEIASALGTSQSFLLGETDDPSPIRPAVKGIEMRDLAEKLDRLTGLVESLVEKMGKPMGENDGGEQ